MVQQKENMKLKHKGRAVKIVKDPTGKCDNCIFGNPCEEDFGACSNIWEAKNKLKFCYDAVVKYIYE